jgi:hypothetical protein
MTITENLSFLESKLARMINIKRKHRMTGQGLPGNSKGIIARDEDRSAYFITGITTSFTLSINKSSVCRHSYKANDAINLSTLHVYYVILRKNILKLS